MKDNLQSANRMHINALFALLIILHSNISEAQETSSIDLCKGWYIYPVLYNNSVCDSNIVHFWENYWYYRKNRSNYIPDTLQIVYVAEPRFMPNMNNSDDSQLSEFTLISTFNFKYGLYEESYNVINPQTSETVFLFVKNINFQKLREKLTIENVGRYNLDTISYPLKNELYSSCIYLQENPPDRTCETLHYLNQLIFKLFVVDSRGNTICSYETIFPINGFYGDENCCK